MTITTVVTRRMLAAPVTVRAQALVHIVSQTTRTYMDNTIPAMLSYVTEYTAMHTGPALIPMS